MNHELKALLEEQIDLFANDPGCSDDEIIETLEAMADEVRKRVRQLEGVAS